MEVSFRQKILNYQNLASWRESFRQAGKQLVVTNGCFDLLHVGHVTYLDSARAEGDALLVGVNSDRAVQHLKGEGRPINTEEDRAGVIAGLESVNFACVFPDVRATEFLRLAQPDVYIKGGDYTLDTLNQEERKVVEAAGGRIVFIPFVPGKSTTSLVQKITRL
ncbi:MAG: adenylyltransferase/cytidyltransferase family protein [Verrucomicrobiales bacterium]